MSKRSRIDEMRRILQKGHLRLNPLHNYAEIWETHRDVNDRIHARDRWGDCIETEGMDVTEKAQP